MFLALHVRQLFKRKPGRILFKQPRLKLNTAASFSSWNDNSLPSSPIMLVCQFDLKAETLRFAALSAALFRMWLCTSVHVMRLYLYALGWFFKNNPFLKCWIKLWVTLQKLNLPPGDNKLEHFIRLSLTFKYFSAFSPECKIKSA